MKTFVSSLLLSSSVLMMGVLSDDHDHDHDDDHDAHSCHYGVIPDLGVPIVEDECASVSFGSAGGISYKFECESSTAGHISYYENTECSGTAVNETEVNDTRLFDCSSESDCDVIIHNRYFYGDNTTMDACGNTSAAAYSQEFYISSGATCVMSGFNDTGTEYLGVTVGEGIFTMSYYSTSSCNTATYTFNFSNGCRDSLSGSGYVDYTNELEEDDDDDDDDAAFKTLYSTIGFSTAFIIAFVSV